MGIQKNSRRLAFGRTVVWLVGLVLIGVILGGYLATRHHQPPLEPARVAPTWQNVLNAPTCAFPVIAITLAALGFTAVRGYYGLQRLEARRRIWHAEAAEREEAVRQSAVRTARRQLELNDLTVNLATGEEVARLMEGPDGKLLLVRPGLATKPVSRLDPDEVREDSDQVRVAAMLANATRYGQGGGPSGQRRGAGAGPLSLELAALAMLNGGGSVEQCLPGQVRILNEEELRMLEDKQRAD